MHSVNNVIPLRFREATVDGYEPTTGSQRLARKAALNVIDGLTRNLVLIGPPGVGKTHLAAAIIATRSQREWDAWNLASEGAERVPTVPPAPAWANVADLIVRLRMEMDLPPDDREGRDLAYRLRTCKGYVVLDDLGREKVTDWTGELVYSVVNARYESRLPTIVTSNLTPDDLTTSPYWPAISRLAEDGALVRISAADHRLHGAA